MKKIKAYALLTARGNFLVTDAKLPFYWRKKVAQLEAEKFHATVIAISIFVPSEGRSKGL